MRRDETGEGNALLWLARGMRRIASLPAIILMSAFVGFAGFARESGVELEHAVFMTAAIWALPAQVVLIAGINAGMTMVPTFIAVTLSSVRMLPMVTTLVPRLRSEGTRTVALLFLSHFVAITSWVMASQFIETVPRRFRTVYFGGFAVTLTTLNIAIVAAVYSFSAAIPAFVLGALFFLTPIYFLTSLWATARERVIRIAMVVGLALGPLFYLVAPGFRPASRRHRRRNGGVPARSVSAGREGGGPLSFTSVDAGWWPFAYILIAGWLATDFWRFAGVLLGRRMSETSQAFLFVRAIATSLVAAVIARLIVFPSGALAETALALRLAAAAIGFAAFLAAGQRIAVGVGVAVAVLIAGMLAGF